MELLTVNKLEKLYSKEGSLFKRNPFKALDGISFYVKNGEILGIVGESGSGKSTLARIISKIEEPNSGSLVWFTSIKEQNPAQIVFQNPYSSFNPKLSIRYSLREAFAYGNRIKISQVTDKQIQNILSDVDLKNTDLKKYPHQFSGGQIQRFAIARALSMKPSLLLLDEATSALDVSVQARILKLVKDLNRKKKLTIVFISHDIDLIAAVADRVLVMKSGRIVESGTIDEVLNAPKDEYTKILIDSVPKNPYR